MRSQGLQIERHFVPQQLRCTVTTRSRPYVALEAERLTQCFRQYKRSPLSTSLLPRAQTHSEEGEGTSRALPVECNFIYVPSGVCCNSSSGCECLKGQCKLTIYLQLPRALVVEESPEKFKNHPTYKHIFWPQKYPCLCVCVCFCELWGLPIDFYYFYTDQTIFSIH